MGSLARWLPPWRGLLVLNYHRVGESGDSMFDRGVYSATAEALDAQLRTLKQHGDIVGPNDIDTIRDVRNGRFLMVTFDDGYRDNYDLAFPLLKSYGITATFFCCTSFLDDGRPAWWDEIAWMVRSSPRAGLPANEWLPAPLIFDEPEREQAVQALLIRYKALPGCQTGAFVDFLAEATESGRCPASVARNIWMTWDMAREMAAAGMSFGGHTVNHPILARLTPDQQDAEIGGCKQRLEAELGTPVDSFAYPVGLPDTFNEATRHSLKAHGFTRAFSFYGGHRQATDWDPYDIRRASVGLGMSLAAFKATYTIPQVFARQRVGPA